MTGKQNKPKKKTFKALDYSECADYINKKYNCNIRDFSRSHLQFFDWAKHKGYKGMDPEGKKMGDSQIWFAEYNKEIKDGKFAERPYQDFWHYIGDVCGPPRGGFFYLHNDTSGAEDWQKQILGWFFDEFGDGGDSIEFYYNW